MSTKTNHKISETSIFAESYSKDLNEVLEAYSNISKRVDTLLMSTINSLPSKSRNVILEDINKFLAQIMKVEPQSKIEEMLLIEAFERLKSMQTSIMLPFRSEFNYEEVMSGMGITVHDVEMFKDHFLGPTNLEELADTWLEVNGSTHAEFPRSLSEADIVRSHYNALLEVTYSIAPEGIHGLFTSFDEYKNLVEFSDERGKPSIQLGEKVYLNLYGADVLTLKRGTAYTRMPDVFRSADIVGEEGLLGHQGQYLLTQSSTAPQTIKDFSPPSTNASIETLGNLGSLRLIEAIKEKHRIFGISEEDFNFLENRSKISSQYDNIFRFIRGYGSFIYFKNGRDIEAMSQELAKIAGSRYASETFKKFTEAHFKSENFWREFNREISVWGYIYADFASDSIMQRLNAIDEEARNNILTYLYTGHWTRKAFEMYVDYLFKEFS